ncbi:hypothetical protein [Propylenella binzhouense]|uniref:Uncharacterized protein n=1 Tax=Propylenella binzhouense TaxID=2555902 RepID=A0A964WW36_9HYPH|nr:hypothetical protein [Propylenella binzhouense]MYZ50465.1 hypothetical protein [Propylenella binzhouense]
MTLAGEPNAALMRDLLAWIALRPRSYGEAIDAWRTNCPRMPVWEDALESGLLRVEAGGAMRARQVVVTAKGAALIGRGAAAGADS